MQSFIILVHTELYQNEKEKVQYNVFMCKFECTSLFRTVSPKLASGVIIFFFLLLGCDTTSILSHSHNTCHIPVHSFIHSFTWMTAPWVVLVVETFRHRPHRSQYRYSPPEAPNLTLVPRRCWRNCTGGIEYPKSATASWSFSFRNRCTWYQRRVASPRAWGVRQCRGPGPPTPRPYFVDWRPFSYKSDSGNQSPPVYGSNGREWRGRTVSLVGIDVRRTYPHDKQDNCSCTCPWNIDVIQIPLPKYTYSIHRNDGRIRRHPHDRNHIVGNGMVFWTVSIITSKNKHEYKLYI